GGGLATARARRPRCLAPAELHRHPADRREHRIRDHRADEAGAADGAGDDERDDRPHAHARPELDGEPTGMDRPRVVPRHGCVLLGSGGPRLRVGRLRSPGASSRTGGQGNPSGSPHRMNQELSDEVGEIMRKLVALSGAAVGASALVASPALADVPNKSKPPVKLQGKVTNKGTATVKKGKVTVETDDF